MAAANLDEFSSSDLGSDWEDELPLESLRALRMNRQVPPPSSSSSEEEEDIGLQEESGNQRWVRQVSGLRRTVALPEYQVPEVPRPEARTVFDFFRLFFTLEFLTSLVTATNTYASEKRAAQPQAHKCKWSDVSTKEMSNFIGLTLIMGIIKKPSFKAYWTTAKEFVTPFFASSMKRDRFLAILRYFNFPPLAAATETVSTAKQRVNWLFRHFNDVTKMVYALGREISIDESMIPHKGRCQQLQYCPQKPNKWGLKVWVLAEATTGYVAQAIPYYGKIDRAVTNIYRDVVLQLLQMAGVLQRYHHLYVDNYFSSVEMFQELLATYSTFCCGTIRINRKNLPKTLMVKKHPDLSTRGNYIFTKAGHLLLVVWKDSKVIHLLTTIHGTLLSKTTRVLKNLTSGRYERQELTCPTAISEYSKFMGGVDLADQLFQYYFFGRKTHKWTKKLFWYLLEVMKINSYIIYKQACGKTLPLLEFSMTLVSEFFAAAELLTPAPNRHLGDGPDRLKGGKCMPGEFEKKSTCKVCYFLVKYSLKAKVSQFKYGCRNCRVHLCFPHCFYHYHSVADYGTTPLEIALIEKN